MATEELPKCSICDEPMVRLKAVSKNKKEAFYVCNKGRESFRMPCDGYAFDIALKNS